MSKKKGNILLATAAFLAVAFVLVDQLYVAGLKKKFVTLELERMQTSNKLATAKIVHENLNHVRDLVFNNMDFPGRADTLDHQTNVFNFITTCANDLRLTLVSVKPLRPQAKGWVTTYGYDIEIEGDFFKFGELCSKFENSRRLVSLEAYEVGLVGGEEKVLGGPENKMIRLKMRINTYRIRKS